MWGITKYFDSAFDMLASRYDVGFAQQVAEQLVSCKQRDIQFLDIKELNDLVGIYRGRLRNRLHFYRSLSVGAPSGHIQKVYVSYEMIFIRRQISDLWKIYRIAIADSHEMTTDYVAQLRTRQYRRDLVPMGKDQRVAA